MILQNSIWLVPFCLLFYACEFHSSVTLFAYNTSNPGLSGYTLQSSTINQINNDKVFEGLFVYVNSTNYDFPMSRIFRRISVANNQQQNNATITDFYYDYKSPTSYFDYSLQQNCIGIVEFGTVNNTHLNYSIKGYKIVKSIINGKQIQSFQFANNYSVLVNRTKAKLYFQKAVQFKYSDDCKSLITDYNILGFVQNVSNTLIYQLYHWSNPNSNFTVDSSYLSQFQVLNQNYTLFSLHKNNQYTIYTADYSHPLNIQLIQCYNEQIAYQNKLKQYPSFYEKNENIYLIGYKLNQVINGQGINLKDNQQFLSQVFVIFYNQSGQLTKIFQQPSSFTTYRVVSISYAYNFDLNLIVINSNIFFVANSTTAFKTSYLTIDLDNKQVITSSIANPPNLVNSKQMYLSKSFLIVLQVNGILAGSFNKLSIYRVLKQANSEFYLYFYIQIPFYMDTGFSIVTYSSSTYGYLFSNHYYRFGNHIEINDARNDDLLEINYFFESIDYPNPLNSFYDHNYQLIKQIYTPFDSYLNSYKIQEISFNNTGSFYNNTNADTLYSKYDNKISMQRWFHYKIIERNGTNFPNQLIYLYLNQYDTKNNIKSQQFLFYPWAYNNSQTNNVTIVTPKNSLDCIGIYNSDIFSINQVQNMSGQWSLTKVLQVSIKSIDVVNIQISKSCTGYRINNKIYIKNTKSNYYQNNSHLTDTGSLDETFNFLVEGNNLYVLNSTDKNYQNVISSDFFHEKLVYASDDGNSVAVLSYYLFDQNIVRFCIKWFVKNNNAWNEVNWNQPNTFIDGSMEHGLPQLYFSSSFANFVIVYYTASLDKEKGIKFIFKYLNSASLTISNILTPFQLESSFMVNYFLQISENYLYVKKGESLNAINAAQISYFELVYKLNRSSISYTNMYKRQMTQDQSTNLQSVRISQIQDDKAKLIYIFERKRSFVIPFNSSYIITSKQIGSLSNFTSLKKMYKTKTGFYITNNKIYPCPSFCSDCLNNITCKTCANGFVSLNPSLRCIKCLGQCKSCRLFQRNICTECFTGFWLNQQNCSKCDQSCHQCNGDDDASCISCKSGYFLNQYEQCQACGNNCQNCINKTHCRSCISGYTNSVQGCVECFLSCSLCSKQDPRKCLGCKPGFQEILNQDYEIQCRKCPQSCRSCSSQQCVQCYLGHQLVSGSCSLRKCVFPCLSCSSLNQSFCLSCTQGYTLNKNSCMPLISCNSEQNCVNCPLGYSYSNKKCVVCDKMQLDQNCRHCNPYNSTECLQCSLGYYLAINNSCLVCSQGCKQCQQQNVCSLCLPGYTLSGDLALSQCLACVEPCLTCFLSPLNCETCRQGFVLNGWKCISINHILFSITFQSRIDNIEYSDFLGITDAIAATINNDNMKMSINSIANGTSISGFIARNDGVDNAEQFQTTNQILHLHFTTDSIISNFKIIQSVFILAYLQQFDLPLPYDSVLKEQYDSMNQYFNMFQWYERTESTTFQKTSYNFMNSENLSSFSINQISKYTLAAVEEEKLSCALVFRKNDSKYFMQNLKANPGQNQKVSFDEINQLISNPNDYYNFVVGQNCQSLIVDDTIVQLKTDNQTYVTTLQRYQISLDSRWVDVEFNADMTVAVSQSGLFLINSQLKSYDLVRQDLYYEDRSLWRYKNNLVIFSHSLISQSPLIYLYKVQANVIENNKIVRIDQIYGNSSQIPTLSLSPQLKVIIVFGKTIQNFTLLISKIIDYQLKIVRLINMTRQITLNKQISLRDNFLYLRDLQANSNNDKYQKGYQIGSRGDVYLSFSKKLLPSQISNRQNTFLKVIDFDSSTVHLLNVYRIQRKYIFQQQIVTIKVTDTTSLQSSYSSSQTINIPKGVKDKFLKTQDMFRTLFSVVANSQTKIYASSYESPEINQNISLISTQLDGNHTILTSLSQDFDCALTYCPEGQMLNVLFINYTGKNGSINLVDNVYQKIVTELGIDPLIAQIQMSSQCNFIKINDVVLNKDPSAKYSPFYLQSNSPLSQANYDKDFAFGVSNNNLYKNVNGTFTQIYSGSFYSENDIFTDLNKTRVIVFSSILELDQGYQFSVKVFKVNQTSCSLIDEQQEVTTDKSKPEVFVSESAQMVIVRYLNEQNNTYEFISLYIDFQKQASYNVEIPDDLANVNQLNSISLANQSLYNRQVNQTIVNKKSIRTGYQKIYKLNSLKSQFYQFYSRNLTNIQFNWNTSQLIQSSGNLFIIYQIEALGSTSSSISFFKRQIGSNDTRNYLNSNQNQNRYYVSKDKVYSCQIGCSNCLHSHFCFECDSMFILRSSTNLCQKCEGTCKSCSNDNLAICLTCISGFWLNQNTCSQCHQSCQQCNGDGMHSCLSCPVGYHRNKLSQCIQCSDNCHICSNSSYCKSCQPGYVPIKDGSCTKCPMNCSYCDPIAPTQCIACRTGFQLVNVNRVSHCQWCPENCESCQNKVCTKCKKGFQVKKGVCVVSCKAPCFECNETDSKNCTSCLGGYIFKGGVCQADISCNLNSNCLSCPFGYFVLQNICYECQTPENCESCSMTDITKCAACLGGFYLTSEGLCDTCSDDCKNCQSKSTCNECIKGYTLSGNQTTSKCIKCQSPCQKCSQSSKNCVTCAENFYKQGWECISQFYIRLSMKLDGQFNSFSVNHYKSVQQQLSNSIQIAESNLHIVSVSSGSIAIEGNIQTFNSIQSQKVANNLKQNLFQGSSIAGFQVLSLQMFLSNKIQANNQTDLTYVFLNLGNNLVAVFIIIISVVLIIHRNNLMKQKQQIHDQIQNRWFILSGQKQTIFDKLKQLQDFIQRLYKLQDDYQQYVKTNKKDFGPYETMLQKMDTFIVQFQKELTRNQLQELKKRRTFINKMIKRQQLKKQEQMKKLMAFFMPKKQEEQSEDDEWIQKIMPPKRTTELMLGIKSFALGLIKKQQKKVQDQKKKQTKRQRRKGRKKSSTKKSQNNKKQEEIKSQLEKNQENKQENKQEKKQEKKQEQVESKDQNKNKIQQLNRETISIRSKKQESEVQIKNKQKQQANKQMKKENQKDKGQQVNITLANQGTHRGLIQQSKLNQSSSQLKLNQSSSQLKLNSTRRKKNRVLFQFDDQEDDYNF